MLCSAVQPHLLVKRSKWAHMLFLIKYTTNLKFYFNSNDTAVTRRRSSARRANRMISLSKLDVEVQVRRRQPCKRHTLYFFSGAVLWSSDGSGGNVGGIAGRMAGDD